MRLRADARAARKSYLRGVARPRDFDLDAALDAAVERFWARGFAATSVRALCEAMGIRPGSFYAAFGSKEACFRRALERYVETQPLPRAPAPEAVRLWLDAIVDPARTPRGCLLVGAAMEHPVLDEASRAAVSAKLTATERFFTACLAGREDPAGDAALLAGTVLAIHVQARAGAPPDKLRALADRALAAVGLADC